MNKSRPRPASEALAEDVWSSLAALVHRHDPTDDLRRVLGLGRGTGRVRALLSLASGPLTVADLARQLDVDPPYATVIANELTALGLVDREPDGSDRRRKRLTLTDAGRAAAATADAIIRKPPAALLALPLDELQQLGRTVARLRELDATS